MNFEDMKLADYELAPEEWGDETDPASDWSLANQFATFSHKDACEFIFYLGDKGGDYDPLPTMKEQGFSAAFVERCRVVQSAGFRYVCFHT